MMRRTRVALVAAILLAISALASAQQPLVRDVAAGAVESFHVRGNVWMLVSPAGNAAMSVGPDGVLLVNTLPAALSEKLLAEVSRIAPNRRIRYVINTSGRAGNIGGNAAVTTREGAAVNVGVTAGNAVGDGVKIISHENTYNRLIKAEPALPQGTLATDTFFTPQKQLFFNDEAIQILHQPNATTDGDLIVFFRRSDVIVAGDVYASGGFPAFASDQGGSYQGVIDGLNSILDFAIPAEKEEGGTYVIPGAGRLADEADVVEYRDMATIVRDRIRSAISKRQTLEQVKAARLLRDYERRYGAAEGVVVGADFSRPTTDAFITEVYRSLQPRPVPARAGSGR